MALGLESDRTHLEVWNGRYAEHNLRVQRRGPAARLRTDPKPALNPFFPAFESGVSGPGLFQDGERPALGGAAP